MLTVGTLQFDAKDFGIVVSYNRDNCLLIIGYDKTFLAEQVKSNWGQLDFAELEICLQRIHQLNVPLCSDWEGVVLTDQFAYSVFKQIKSPAEELFRSFNLLQEAKKNRETLSMYLSVIYEKMIVLIEIGLDCRVRVLRSQEHIEAVIEELDTVSYVEPSLMQTMHVLHAHHSRFPDTDFLEAGQVNGVIAELVISLLISSATVPYEQQLISFSNCPWSSNAQNN